MNFVLLIISVNGTAVGLYAWSEHRDWRRHHTYDKLKRKQVPIDVTELGIGQLSSTSNENTVRNTHLQLQRGSKNQAILSLPEGSFAASVLRHGKEVVVKIISPDYRTNGRLDKLRVCLLGKDVTGQPWMRELPEDYATKTLDECERWLLPANSEDVIMAT